MGGDRGGVKSERGVLMGVDGEDHAVLRGVSNPSLSLSLGKAPPSSFPFKFFSGEVNEKMSIVTVTKESTEYVQRSSLTTIITKQVLTTFSGKETSYSTTDRISISSCYLCK